DTPMHEDTPANTQTSAVASPADSLNALVADALKQQASQFEAIINGLQTQIGNLAGLGTQAKKDKNKSASSNNPYATPSVSRTAPRQTSSTSKNTPNSTPKSTPKSCQKKKTPEALRKRHVLQVTTDELPVDFKSTKEALYVHIKMMWGLFKKNNVPPSPSPNMLQEFYLQFSNSDEIEH
ncbi:hypothetical protein DFH28DRAFT_826041, partial [Melampsora americana]